MRLRTLLLLSAAACGQDFAPYSLADDLRLLAVKAEPPEIGAPGSALPTRATVTALVSDPLQLDEQLDSPACAALPRPAPGDAGVPADGCRTATVLHLACTPDPASLAASPCTSLASLRDPTSIGQLLRVPSCEPGSSAPFGEGIAGGVTLVGIEECDQRLGCRPAAVRLDDGVAVELPEPAFSLPDGYDVSVIPEGEFARTGGLEVVIFSIAFPGTLQSLVPNPTADTCAVLAQAAPNLAGVFASPDTLLAVKRLDIRGPDADVLADGETEPPAPNVNPDVAGILADGRPLGPTPLVVQRAQGVQLLPRPPAGLDELFQRYRRLSDTGSVIESNIPEAWLITWFVTAGDVSPNRAENFGTTVDWVAPKGNDQNFGEDVPRSGRLFLYVVARDRRGGIDWSVGEICIAGSPCDPAAADE